MQSCRALQATKKMGIKKIKYSESYKKDIKRFGTSEILKKIEKQIKKIITNPSIGKPLRYGFAGTKEVRITPFRLIFSIQDSTLMLWRFEHRGKIFKK